MSPEHLSRAFDEEVKQRTIINEERELMDAMPAAVGAGFIDLKKAPCHRVKITQQQQDEEYAEHEEEKQKKPESELEKPAATE